MMLKGDPPMREGGGTPGCSPPPCTPLHPHPGVPGAMGHPWNPLPHPGHAPLVQRGRGWVRTRLPVPGHAPSQCRQGASVPPKSGRSQGSRKAPQIRGGSRCSGEPPQNRGGPRCSGEPPQIRGGSCGPGEPPKFGEGPAAQESPPNSGRVLRPRRAPPDSGRVLRPGPPPAPSWGPHQGWGGGFGSARLFPSRAEAPEGCQEVFGYFRVHSGVSAPLGYFRLHSESRRSGRRSALPAALGGKSRRKLRATPSWRRKHSKSVTAASRTSPGRAEAARGGVSGVSGAAAEMAEGRRRPPCWEPRGAEAAAA
ncbi:basic salivary proline-rich protein 2-like [Passer montanus]|uniref:basic salivary proline-rich protein 2-like n=1 Tax=Passer montanus TaxID=9160 RepID=UPI00195F2EC8|nr:basic salivary proline-rich protein 2-like [Passer montanus]